MKKWISLFTLFAVALWANPPQAEQTAPDTSSTYTAPNPSVREKEKAPSNKWRATAAVVGTLAAVTLGLFLSGRDVGKDAPHATK
ncbi:MAG: hypothetical protein KDK63_05690 [Chlamydiia bacterium]|nr:hypothetical protein [Chlamydiia bacterium]MCB1115212.1 hypothetical protein [Chlamydiia bacterium]